MYLKSYKNHYALVPIFDFQFLFLEIELPNNICIQNERWKIKLNPVPKRGGVWWWLYWIVKVYGQIKIFSTVSSNSIGFRVSNQTNLSVHVFDSYITPTKLTN